MIAPADISNQRILISVLNWGMGHVARSIGLIHLLIQNENKIFIAGDDKQLSIFKEYFPDCVFIQHDAYPFKFKGKGNFALDLILQSKNLFTRMKREKKEVENYVRIHRIDMVLSDHRYGFIHSTIPTVFITHQLNLPLKWYQKGAQRLHLKMMQSFSYIWVMDDEKHSFAGKLSENLYGLDVIYIGPFSRFTMYQLEKRKKDKIVFIASGPTVYAEQFEDDRFAREAMNDSILLSTNNKDFPTWKEKDEIILSAKKIISRSGYSTIMDAHFLKCETDLYPTKGQAEQEYLASLHQKSPTNR